jgi:hypothetical protein
MDDFGVPEPANLSDLSGESPVAESSVRLALRPARHATE